MNDRNWGGARAGAGRPAHGKTSKCITMTFTIQQAEQLQQLAAEAELSVSQYVVQQCKLVGGPTRKNQVSKTPSTNSYSLYSLDSFQMVAEQEPEDFYKVEKK